MATAKPTGTTTCCVCRAPLNADEVKLLGEDGLQYQLCATPRTDGKSCFERMRHALWRAVMDAAAAERELRDVVARAPGGVAELGLPDMTQRKLQTAGLLTVEAVEDAYWAGTLTDIDGFGPTRMRWIGCALAARMDKSESVA